MVEILPHGRQNLFILHICYNLVAASLMVGGPRASAAMVLTCFSENIPVSAPDELILMIFQGKSHINTMKGIYCVYYLCDTQFNSFFFSLSMQHVQCWLRHPGFGKPPDGSHQWGDSTSALWVPHTGKLDGECLKNMYTFLNLRALVSVV